MRAKLQALAFNLAMTLVAVLIVALVLEGVLAAATVPSERRATAPWGLAGGAPGAPGRNRLLPADGSPARDLPAKFTRRMRAGEGLEISTPRGGGWGPLRSS